MLVDDGSQQPGRGSEGRAIYLLAASALLVFFASDALNKIFLVQTGDIVRISIVLKLVYEVIFFCWILVFINQERFKFLLALFLFVSMFLAGQLFVIGSNSSLGENLITLNKYLFTFVLYQSFYKIQHNEARMNSLANIMEKLFTINNILTLAGLFFGIKYFRSYVDQAFRFGYDGLIPAQNEATYFFMISVSYFYYKYYFLNKSFLQYLLAICAALLLGAKGIYIFLLILFAFHILCQRRHRFVYLMILALPAAVVALYLPFVNSYGIQYFISQYENSGFLSTALSGRDTFITGKFLTTLSHWTVLNYFTGGQDVNNNLIEMDVFDLFLFFGSFGMFLYLYLYKKLIFRLTFKNYFNCAFMLSILVVAFVGGHFFASAVNSIYIVIFTMYLRSSQSALPKGSPLLADRPALPASLSGEMCR